MVDIARRSGVSVTTVSRVMNDPDLVDPAKREAVREFICEAGYRPIVLAQGLVKQSSKTIGAVINQFSSSYYGRMLDGAQNALTDAGFKAIAESSRESDPFSQLRSLSLLHRLATGLSARTWCGQLGGFGFLRPLDRWSCGAWD